MTDRAADDFRAIAKRLRVIQDHGDAATCSTCDGFGLIDESLGGELTSGYVPCPDCDGTGEAPAP